MAKELIRVPRVLGESYNSVLIERLYEAGGNVMLDLIIYLGSYHLKDLFGTSWFSVEDFCRKMGYDRTNCSASWIAGSSRPCSERICSRNMYVPTRQDRESAILSRRFLRRLSINWDWRTSAIRPLARMAVHPIISCRS